MITTVPGLCFQLPKGLRFSPNTFLLPSAFVAPEFLLVLTENGLAFLQPFRIGFLRGRGGWWRGRGRRWLLLLLMRNGGRGTRRGAVMMHGRRGRMRRRRQIVQKRVGGHFRIQQIVLRLDFGQMMLMMVVMVMIFVVGRRLLQMMLIMMMVMMMITMVRRRRRSRGRIHAVAAVMRTATAVTPATTARMRLRFGRHHAGDAGNGRTRLVHDGRVTEMGIVHHHFGGGRERWEAAGIGRG